MKADVLEYCRSCDSCQKTKFGNFNKFRFLIPNSILSCPYQSISMDFIINLPWSNDFNAIFVVVDRLTKQGTFIPCTTSLTTEEFAKLFVRHIICRFSLPNSIIMDHDPQWTSNFWRGVVQFLKMKMSLSSAHHPQHDGQTEILNQQLMTMLRAYVADDLSDWLTWLHILEFAYNNSIHGSTGASPNFLMYGFQPKSPLDFLLPKDIVFASSVLWTKKIHRTELNRTVVRSIFQLQLHKFGVIPVAGCLISKIIQNRSKTG